MDYKEIEELWKRYDSKLDNLENLNKKLLVESLAKKPQRKLTWLQYQSYFGLLIGPVIVIFVLPIFYKESGVNTLFIIGGILFLGVFVYSMWIILKSINALKSIDIINNSVIESVIKINDYKRIVLSRQKSSIISLPITLAGILLLGWQSFNFDETVIAFIIILLVFMVFRRKSQYQSFKKRIDNLLAEINELKEYKD